MVINWDYCRSSWEEGCHIYAIKDKLVEGDHTKEDWQTSSDDYAVIQHLYMDALSLCKSNCTWGNFSFRLFLLRLNPWTPLNKSWIYWKKFLVTIRRINKKWKILETPHGESTPLEQPTSPRLVIFWRAHWFDWRQRRSGWRISRTSQGKLIWLHNSSKWTNQCDDVAAGCFQNQPELHTNVDLHSYYSFYSINCWCHCCLHHWWRNLVGPLTKVRLISVEEVVKSLSKFELFPADAPLKMETNERTILERHKDETLQEVEIGTSPKITTSWDDNEVSPILLLGKGTVRAYE